MFPVIGYHSLDSSNYIAGAVVSAFLLNIFYGTRVYLAYSLKKIRDATYSRLDLLIRFDKTPTCNRQTDGHRATAHRASIASRL